MNKKGKFIEVNIIKTDKFKQTNEQTSKKINIYIFKSSVFIYNLFYIYFIKNPMIFFIY